MHGADKSHARHKDERTPLWRFRVGSWRSAQNRIMIDRHGNPTGDLLVDRDEETTMLKTISATLLAVSVLAAPALAAGQGDTAKAPATKAQQVKPVKTNMLNANATMKRHRVRHHRHHKHM